MRKHEKREIPRPTFPKRAVITGGMPYGSKELHFGHVGGMFVHADVFARFLRDRIGPDNVVFVSGTDCYGSPIVAAYNQKVDSGEFEGSLEDFVTYYHDKQKETLDAYGISLNHYAASALGSAASTHREVCEDFFNTLYNNGFLKKMETAQFYDPEADMLLNGRQVVGRCPIPGCTSDKGYADECALGHPYNPVELINPISTLSGKKPELVPITNWYFDLEAFNEPLQDMVQWRTKHSNFRKYSLSTINEFLNLPIIYVQKNQVESEADFDTLLTGYRIVETKTKSSYALAFDSLDDREIACKTLDQHNIRYRKGKTLVPFRLSGNVDWGVALPDKDGLTDLTFWVWPESLFAPISFTKDYLNSIGKPADEWKKYWTDDDAEIYQFIGEDCLYFYGVAQMAMWMGYNSKQPHVIGEGDDLRLTQLVANNHLLYMDKKSSSSGDIKPPMAGELLDYYTQEQLRMHFISLGLAKKSTNFQPMALTDSDEFDGVLKEGNLLTNVLNRLIRSCFYTAQKYELTTVPACPVAEDIMELSKKAILDYERFIARFDMHQLTNVLDSYIRKMSKHWSKNIREAENNEDMAAIQQVLADCFHSLKVAAALLHPIVPDGSERMREYLRISEDVYNWDHIFDPIHDLLEDGHTLKFLEPRVDFFVKHPRQLEF